MSDYDNGYLNGHQHGVVAGRKQSADTLRLMLKTLAESKEPDIARTAALLLDGFNQEMAGKL